MMCGDPLVESLKDAGYNVLAIPRADFAPLALLRSKYRRTLHPLGSLIEELSSDRPPPAVRTGESASDLTVTRSRRLSGSLGAEVLGRLLQAVGAPTTAAAELSREEGTSIVLTGVVRDSVGEGDLAAYLEGDVRPRTQRTCRLAEAGEVFVVTAVLRSQALRVETTRKIAARVTASVSVAPGVAPQVETAGGVNGTSTLTYQGEVALPFGFQAVKLSHRDGRWSNFTDADGHIAYLTERRSHVGRQLLILDDDLVEEEVEEGVR